MSLIFFKGRVYVLRYEDLSLKPRSTRNRLMSFLDLSPKGLVEYFWKEHTYKNGSPNDPYSKTRNSKYTALKWVKFLSEDDIYIVQKACEEPMRLLGYNFMSNIHHDKKNKRFPTFSKSARQLWPDQFQ